MSDPNQPANPTGSGDEPAPPPPPPPPPPPTSGSPYGSAPDSGAPTPPPYGGSGDTGNGGYGAPPPPSDGQQAYGQPGQVMGGEQPGGLADRFLARLIDGVLLFVVTLIIDLVLLAGILGMTAGGLGVGGSYGYAALSAVITTAINLGYFGYLESSRGQTLGKMALKLRVQTTGGSNPTLEQAIKRNIWLALPILGIVPILGGVVAGLGELVAVIMIAVGISKDAVTRRPWTDKYAETRVLKVG